MPKIRVNITIDEEILEKGKEIAKSQNRTLSNYVQTIIIKEIALEERRYRK